MVFFDTGGSRGIGSGIALAAARSELRVNGGLDWAP